jgi:hypothetical protein
MEKVSSDQSNNPDEEFAMTKNQSSLSRRRLGAVGVIGGVSLVLGGMSGCTEKVIPVYVDDGPNGRRVRDIEEEIDIGPFVKRIKFVSATPGWYFAERDADDSNDDIILGRAPRAWLTPGENGLTVPIARVSEDGLSCVTERIPKKGRLTLHVYFVMTKRSPDTQFDPNEGIDAANGVGPRYPGDCGGGGEVFER